MKLDIYLQVISILMGVIAVALPLVITAVGLVYVRRLREKVDNAPGKLTFCGTNWKKYLRAFAVLTDKSQGRE